MSEEMTFKEKEMSAAEWKAYKKTTEGARRWCQIHNYDVKKCGRELEFLHGDGEAESQSLYDSLYKRLRNEFPNEKEEVIEMFTENRMINRLVAPPSWKEISVCKNCGPMPSYYKSDVELVGCPWCHVIKDKTEEEPFRGELLEKIKDIEIDDSEDIPF